MYVLHIYVSYLYNLKACYKIIFIKDTFIVDIALHIFIFLVLVSTNIRLQGIYWKQV